MSENFSPDSNERNYRSCILIDAAFFGSILKMVTPVLIFFFLSHSKIFQTVENCIHHGGNVFKHIILPFLSLFGQIIT